MTQYGNQNNWKICKMGKRWNMCSSLFIYIQQRLAKSLQVQVLSVLYKINCFQILSRQLSSFSEWRVLVDESHPQCVDGRNLYFHQIFQAVCDAVVIVNNGLVSLQFTVFYKNMFLFVLCSYPPFVFFTGFLWLPPIFTDHLLFFQSMCDTLSLAFLMFNVNWHNIILSSYLHMKSIWSKVFFTISPGCLLLITESSNWNNSVRKSCLKFSSETNFSQKTLFVG